MRHRCHRVAKCLRGGAGMVECLVVHRRPTEVAGHPGAKHADDEMREPPGDGGDRRRAGLGIGEVDDEVAAAGRDRCASVSPRVDVPAIGHRLPEVFGVGQPRIARAQLPAPVPVQLLGQLMRPVDAHGLSLAPGGPGGRHGMPRAQPASAGDAKSAELCVAPRPGGQRPDLAAGRADGAGSAPASIFCCYLNGGLAGLEG